MPATPITVAFDIGSRFNVLGYPNGGHLARLAAQTLAQHVDHPDLLALHASFIGHPVSAPATAQVTGLGATRSLSRATLALEQDGELKAFYVATFTGFDRTKGATGRFAPDAHRTPMADCVPLASLNLHPAMQSFVDCFDVRLAPGCLHDTGPSKAAEVEGWIALADGTPPTPETLVLFADAFPPPVYNVIDRSQWGSVPTVEYTVHVKARPAAGPVHGRFWSKEVSRGLLEIDGELRDVNGTLVAESRQLAKFRGELG